MPLDLFHKNSVRYCVWAIDKEARARVHPVLPLGEYGFEKCLFGCVF